MVFHVAIEFPSLDTSVSYILCEDLYSYDEIFIVIKSH